MSVFIYLSTIINVVLIRCNGIKLICLIGQERILVLPIILKHPDEDYVLIYLSKLYTLSLINCSPIQTPNFSWSNHYIWNLFSLLQAVRDSRVREIDHFRVPKTVTFRRRPSAQPFPVKMSFPCIKKSFPY